MKKIGTRGENEILERVRKFRLSSTSWLECDGKYQRYPVTTLGTIIARCARGRAARRGAIHPLTLHTLYIPYIPLHQTPLHVALEAEPPDEELIALLLARGADPNARGLP